MIKCFSSYILTFLLKIILTSYHMWSGFPIHRKRNLLMMSFFALQNNPVRQQKGIISLILLRNWGQRLFDLPKVTQLDIGGSKTSTMPAPGTEFFVHTTRKLKRERKKFKRTKRNQNISLYCYLVLACRTGMTLPSLLSGAFSFPESLSRTSCFFFRA